MISRVRRTTAAALLAGAVGIGPLGPAQAHPSAAGLASVSITSPIGTAAHPQTAERDGSFTIRVAVQNFTFDQSHIGVKPNRTGVGHYHVYADSFNPAQPFKFWILAAATTSVRVGLAALAHAGVAPGVHTLYVVLANNDHSLVEPLAIASTVVRVVPPPALAGVALASPPGTPNTPLLPGDDGAFTFAVAVQHFNLDAAHIGAKANRPGSGHYHVYADGIDPRFTFKYWIEAGASPTVKVSLDALAKAGVSAGTHTIFVVLANNDHSLLQPLVMASTVVRIGPSLHVAELANPTQPVVIPANGKVTLHVNVNSFRLDPRGVGSKTDTPGAGHYHVYVNSFDPGRPQLNYVVLGTGPTVDVTAAALAKLGIKVGVHAIYVVLANNDHTLSVPLTAVGGLIQVGS